MSDGKRTREMSAGFIHLMTLQGILVVATKVAAMYQHNNKEATLPYTLEEHLILFVYQ